MALTDNVIMPGADYQAICDAVRAKTGKTALLTSGELVSEIAGIQTGIEPSGTKNITENGTHDVTAYASAEVNVEPLLENRQTFINGVFTPTEGFDGIAQFTVNVPTYITVASEDALPATATDGTIAIVTGG